VKQVPSFTSCNPANRDFLRFLIFVVFVAYTGAADAAQAARDARSHVLNRPIHVEGNAGVALNQRDMLWDGLSRLTYAQEKEFTTVTGRNRMIYDGLGRLVIGVLSANVCDRANRGGVTSGRSARRNGHVRTQWSRSGRGAPTLR
jgi:hypothetical protein